MLCYVALVRTDVSEEHITSIIRFKRISELGKTLAFTSSLMHFTLIMQAMQSSETPVLTRFTRRHIPEDGNLYRYVGLE
jgi:hypothetical protein